MNIITWAEKKGQSMKWYDYAVLKICVASVVLFLAKLFPAILEFAWYWYLGVFVVSYFILLFSLLVKNKRKSN